MASARATNPPVMAPFACRHPGPASTSQSMVQCAFPQSFEVHPRAQGAPIPSRLDLLGAGRFSCRAPPRAPTGNGSPRGNSVFGR